MVIFGLWNVIVMYLHWWWYVWYVACDLFQQTFRGWYLNCEYVIPGRNVSEIHDEWYLDFKCYRTIMLLINYEWYDSNVTIIWGNVMGDIITNIFGFLICLAESVNLFPSNYLCFSVISDPVIFFLCYICPLISDLLLSASFCSFSYLQMSNC